MLRNSFILLDGVGQQREMSLWREGVSDWKRFLELEKVKGISEKRKGSLDGELLVAEDMLRKGDSEFFATRVARREHWRCLDEFRGSVAYLDIETTGLSPRSPVTVVGIHDGTRTHTLVRGQNLTAANIRGILSSARTVVTFNGSSFDLPMIASQFPGCVPRVPHVDLKHSLRRLGYTGGLKAIERELGVERDRRVEYMTGEDAAYLWRLWEREGKRNALELLVEYNTEDCRNLKGLAEFAYRSLRRRTYERMSSAGKG
ncbi:MAG: hypothetical protein A3K67_03630 [Euryarchaeota archaeon RBG_16_62_10]|nr:MAG: hypothetical protein A3K67_03630 [Euryarchaeota archaeon RBG_16_62_10]